MIGAADLPVKGQTFDTISEAVDHLGIDRALLSGIDPQRGPIRTLTDIAAIARQTPTLAVKLLGSDWIDAHGDPIDATNLWRCPNRRQRRLLKAHDHACADWRRAELLEYDHVPAFTETGHTITAELALRYSPCHSQRDHGHQR
mgnify:CR=1 FL=1